MATDNQDKKATPLVLPNNCTWNERTGECKTNKNVERKTLDVHKKGLDQLKEIKGDVCVVSIAGPCRQGKSYILSKAFDQGQVFPLGSKLDPETMGVWLWVVPEKFQDNNGREFIVVLLDSEGIDATSGKGSNDHSVFTLSVLLSSIMIYNSVGRPTRSDLENLESQLSQRIELHTNTSEQDVDRFFQAFPYFIWLLRDVLLKLPDGCSSIYEYFMKNVLNDKVEGNEQSRKTAESILTYFCGFDAFSLPPPAYEPEVVKNLDDEALKSQINPKFIGQVEEFKNMIKTKLSPKKAINEGEFITGEALAALVELYVKALNTPGTVHNVQNAWDTFVHTKCTELLGQVLKEYENEVKSQVENNLPCEADEIRAVHDKVMETSRKKFHKETISLSTNSVDKYLKEMTVKTNPILSNWLEKNRQETEKQCIKLIKELKKDILDPVLARLRSSEGCKMDFGDIVAAYNKIEQEYTSKARGAKEVQATVFLNFHPELQKEMEQNVDLLKKMKDYNESLAKEKAEKAWLEEQRLKIEEENARMAEETRNKERELAVIREKQKEEEKRLREMIEKNKKDYEEQLNNMRKANLDDQRKQREELLAGQKTLEEKIETMTSTFKEKENTFKELVQNNNDKIASMQTMYINIIEEAKAREHRLHEAIDRNAEAQIHERAAAEAREDRLQETIDKTVESQVHERAAAKDREDRLSRKVDDITDGFAKLKTDSWIITKPGWYKAMFG